MSRRTSAAMVAASLLLSAGHAAAQWASDPSENLIVTNAASDQNQPKIALGRGGSAGSSYVSWLDGIGTGWDVRIQRLSDDGTPLWPAGGVLVADRDFTATHDYGLNVDADGNAWVAFRLGNSETQIAVQKVAPDGTLLLNGGAPLVLTSGSSYHDQPKVAATSDGNAVVAWLNDSDVQLMKISGVDGSTMWSITEVAGVGLANAPCDLHAADAGSVILSFSHGDSFFLAPKHLWANKYAADGSVAWGAPTVIFDLAGLPLGNFPRFISDGAGGGVFTWHSPNTDAYVQHVLADGTEAFPHNGVTLSTHLGDLQVSPSVVYDAASDQTYVFWLERSGNQSQFGVYGQKIDGESAARQWGDEGRAIVPLDGVERSFVSAVAAPGGAIVAWFEGGFSSKAVRAARIDTNGDALWGPLDVSTSFSDKGRLTAAVTPNGMAITAWSDQRTDNGDIYAQNINPDGTLGAPPAACLCETDGQTAQVDVFDLLAYLDLWFTNSPAANLDDVPEVDVFDLLTYLDCWFPASAGSPCP